VNAAVNPAVWSAVPFHFWSVVFFVFGSMVGSFLNVCIHRLPLGQSVVTPGSHCPACKYAIPWYLNIPLLTWVYLGGKCRNCRAPISVRYLLVELLTAMLFCACWLAFGAHSAWLALIYSFFLAGLIAATFIDAEHEIIPDGQDLQPRPLKPAAPRRLPKHVPDHISRQITSPAATKPGTCGLGGKRVQTTQPGQPGSAGEAAAFMSKDCVTMPELGWLR
jgi:hypothetical protein